MLCKIQISGFLKTSFKKDARNIRTQSLQPTRHLEMTCNERVLHDLLDAKLLRISLNRIIATNYRNNKFLKIDPKDETIL